MTRRPPRTTALTAAAVVLLTAAALAFRLPALGNRPFHGDEAVHAFKFRDVWEHGVYRYDPNEFHGPTLYYAALPTVWASGHHRFADTTEADYRAATALVGAAMVPLLLLLHDALGRRATLVAAVLTALSPAFVFYSRYYIQEVLLAAFTLAALGCAWRYRQSGRIGWLLGAAACAGLMVATKETAVLTFAAAVVAWFVTVRGRRRRMEAEEGEADAGRTAAWARGAAAVVVALVVAYLFLSGFFSDPQGPLGYLKTYTPWTERASGTQIHNHPWSYYFRLLLWTHAARGPVWTEAVIVGLAVVGGIAAFARRRNGGVPVEWCPGFARYLTVYTVVLTAIYCAIPYKTPWLVLSFLDGMILLAGIGAAAILDALRPVPLKAAALVLLAAGCAQLGWLAWATSFVYYTDGRNPWVYAQPSPDVARLGRKVEELSRFSPQRDAMLIKVLAADTYYWPLPWYLRRFPNVGYWTDIPPDPDAPVVIASSQLDEALTPKLPNSLMTGYYGLRPSVFFELFVRMDVWQPYVMSRKNRKVRVGE